MLGFMKDDTEVGYYTASVKVKSILVSFVTALSTVLLPRVSYYIEHGLKEEFQKVSRKALNFVVVVAVPVVVYFTLYAKESILLLSGTEFMGAVEPMKIIMPTVLFIGITNVLGIQILVPLGREMAVCISVMVGAVVDLMINAVCIPNMAPPGAAFGTVIAGTGSAGGTVLDIEDTDPRIYERCSVAEDSDSCDSGSIFKYRSEGSADT